MNFALILFAALLPVVILLCIILFLDRKRPEPAKKLFKAFFFGILSVFLSFCISIPLGELGVYSDEFTTVLGSFGKAFFGAAIPEEIAKFFMLWLLLRKNRYFDEMMDGIVYAACILWQSSFPRVKLRTIFSCLQLRYLRTEYMMHYLCHLKSFQFGWEYLRFFSAFIFAIKCVKFPFKRLRSIWNMTKIPSRTI